jgi:glycosyltransferase involved in cell wall biosynthesis
MKVSLVLCTRNRAAQLQKCLASLAQVEPPDAPVEVVIVDNGSTDGTAQVIRDHLQGTPWPTRTCLVARAGLSLARNCGVQASTGDLIAFTDDDCYLGPGYFRDLAGLVDPQVFQYGMGQILLHDSQDDERVANLRIDRNTLIPPRTPIIPAGMVQGANMFFMRRVFQVAGGFCEQMGAGTPFPCEDIEMACRASHHGFTGALLPGLSVHHHHGRKRHSAAAEAAIAAYDAGRGAYYASLVAQGVGQAWHHWGHSFLGQGKLRSKSELVQLSRELLGAARYVSLLAGEPDPLQPTDQEPPP